MLFQQLDRMALNQVGLVGEDQDSAVAAYAAGGPLSADDIGTFRDLPPAERQAELVRRYGSDGARVAAVLVSMAT